MKGILTIIIAFASLQAFGQTNIFMPNKAIIYAIEYTTGSKTVKDTINITATGRPWRVDPTNQQEIIITYNLKNLDKSAFIGLPSIGWVNTDTTGAVDNDKVCWFHPPRHNQYKILELAPFPRVEYPLEVDKIYSRVLFIGDGWGDISNTKVAWKYRITGYNNDTWTISAQAIPDNKPTNINHLDFNFSTKEGFTSLHYKFSDGVRIKMTRIK